MEDIKKYESFLNEGIKLYGSGYDERYIELQLAEKGADDDSICKVLKHVKTLKKGVRRRMGMKKMIYGLSTVAIALLGTAFSFGPGSPVEFILWGAAAFGVLNIMKGLAEIMGLI